ncbi:MAG: hypothetical protein NW208_03270 [Bryobacter sp.]|nr:hypothetical protein [Bryobacter sp.]
MPFFLFLLCGLTLFGQYNPYPAQVISMATNQDGSQLWFTSAVRPVGLTLDQGEHLWRWDGQRVQLVASPNRARDARTIFRVATGPRPGQVAWEEYRPCLFGAGCGFRNLHTSQIRRGLELQDYLGPLQFSEDGRYFYNYRTDAENLGDARFSHNVEDWETGQRNTLSAPGLADPSLQMTGRWITNDGSVLVDGPNGLVLVARSGEETRFGPFSFREFSRLPGAARPVYVDPQGRFITFFDGKNIVLRDRTLNEVVIAKGDRLQGATANGEVVYLARSEDGIDQFLAYSYLTAQTRVIAKLNASEGTAIETGLLSRDESTIYLLLTQGDILRIRGKARTMLRGYGRRITSPPNFNGLVSSFTALDAWAPGGTHFLDGRNLDGAAIQSDFGPLSILYANSQRLIFEVPAGYSPTPRCAEDCPFVRLQFPGNLELPLRSYGLVPFNRALQEAIPLISESPGDPLRYLIHGDWRGPVTESDPAQPGDIVHFYAVNLVPVNGRISCQAMLSDPPVGALEVLYAGTAPGLIGIQQVSLRLPLIDALVLGIRCERSLFVPIVLGIPVFVP